MDALTYDPLATAIIDLLDGPSATAQLCSTADNPVSSESVCNWRRRGIPAGYLYVIELLRPDVIAQARAEPPDG